MYYIALRMLFGDRAKYLVLVSTLAFATLLMAQQSGVFTGLMIWTTATLRDTNIPVWVMDPQADQVNEVKPMRDTDLNRVRSVKGVLWAVPYYFSLQQARMYNGRFKTVKLVGLDSSTLIGAPPKIIKGSLEMLWQANSVMVDKIGLNLLSNGREKPLDLGDSFEINDFEVRIVAICEAARSFFGYPYVFTTYNRAVQIAPPTRRNLAFVLVQPQEGWTPENLAQEIENETGLKALSEHDFFWDTIWWFVENTGIPFSFGITIFLGFLVGTTVCGQTFYTFILENLGNLGALKAMGASSQTLYKMLMVQALYAGFVGYGIGIGLTALFGFFTLGAVKTPFYMPVQIVVTVFLCVMFICLAAAFLGIRRISKLEPAEVFRG